MTRHAAQCRSALPADPDRRMWSLHRLGCEDDIVERDEFARHGRCVGGPERLEGFQKFVRDAPSGIEVGSADGLEFLAQPTRADTKVNAPSGEQVHGRNRLGREHRRTARHHHDGGKDSRLLRYRCHMGHQHKLLHAIAAVPDELAGGIVGIARGVALRDDDEVGHREPDETALLRLCGERPYGFRSGQRASIGDGQTEFHDAHGGILSTDVSSHNPKNEVERQGDEDPGGRQDGDECVDHGDGGRNDEAERDGKDTQGKPEPDCTSPLHRTTFPSGHGPVRFGPRCREGA